MVCCGIMAWYQFFELDEQSAKGCLFCDGKVVQYPHQGALGDLGFRRGHLQYADLSGSVTVGVHGYYLFDLCRLLRRWRRVQRFSLCILFDFSHRGG